MALSQAPGASRDEWQHFSSILGLTEDLLPVVSNAQRKISSLSSLKSIGKTPSRLDGQGCVVGIKQWTQIKASAAQVQQWSYVPDYGICIQTRRLRALDVDIDDLGQVDEVCELIARFIPFTYCRRREGSSRVLIPFWCAGPLDKRVIRLPRSAGQIELLADGQQFIAAGTHPDGGRYFWEGGLPGAFPVVPRETLGGLQ